MDNKDIVLEKVVKKYGFASVINGLDLTVDKGEFFTVYGPNGAGKTTLLMILSTLVKPTEGEIRISSLNYNEHRDRIRQMTGLVSHNDYIYENLTAYENLYFFASLYNVANIKERVEYLLDKMGLYSRRDDLIRSYSRGMKKRISIARSLVHDPAIVLFDEPFSGLDQKAIRTFSEILSWMKSNNRTVLLTTHNIRYIWHLSDRIGIMNDGKIENTVEYSDSLEQKAEELYGTVCIE